MTVVELDLGAAQRRMAFGVLLAQLISAAGAPPSISSHFGGH